MTDFKNTAREYKDRIFTMCWYMLGNMEDAEDVTQEVLIRLWKHMEQLKHDPVRAWISRVSAPLPREPNPAYNPSPPGESTRPAIKPRSAAAKKRRSR